VTYRLIVCDPPWAFGDKLTMSDVARGASSNYATLDLDAICALPVDALADDDALLALWVPSSMVGDGLRVMEAWGFAQKQVWVWTKTSKAKSGLAFGMGRLGRNCHEIAIIGTRGKISRHVSSKSERTVILAPALPHSQKPEEFQTRLERLIPGGRRLELFSRRQRFGWTCWGNEAPATMGRDIREVMAEALG